MTAAIYMLLNAHQGISIGKKNGGPNELYVIWTLQFLKGISSIHYIQYFRKREANVKWMIACKWACHD